MDKDMDLARLGIYVLNTGWGMYMQLNRGGVEASVFIVGGAVHLSTCVVFVLFKCGVLNCQEWILEMSHLLEKAFGGHVMMMMMEASNQIVIAMYLWRYFSQYTMKVWSCYETRMPPTCEEWKSLWEWSYFITYVAICVLFRFHFLSFSFIPCRLCLGLFEEVPPAIQSELNLIASLSLLDDFGVSILPVQVRLCENKLDIIRNVLDASHNAYKQHEKVEAFLSWL